MISWGQAWKWGNFCMHFLPLKFSHYPSRPVPVPELFCKYPTRPIQNSKTPTRRTLITCLVPKNQPDQRRSHIGPNAGGSLNLSNWKSKLCNALHNAVKMFHLRGLSNQEHSKFSALEGTFLMSSNVWISGLSPPCTQRNCWFMRAARGRQSKASMHASYTRSVYLILPRGQSVNVCVAYDVEDWLRK